MIEKILERLAEREDYLVEQFRGACDIEDLKWLNRIQEVENSKKIVQEVANQYSEPVNKRCLTCANYDGEEIVDNICYLCCKGFEDNYVAKDEYEKGYEDGAESVRALAPYEDDWISCSERLPSKEEYQKCNGQFIVSDGNRTYATYFDIYDTLKFGEPTIERFRVDRVVIAWQPLPAPYQKGE